MTTAGEEFVYIGLRCIGRIRRGRVFEAWAEPGDEALGVFPSHELAARTIYDNDVKQRLQKAGEVKGKRRPGVRPTAGK